MSDYLKRVSEAVRVLAGQAVGVDLVNVQWGRKPAISFKTMMDCYRKDVVFRDSIDLLTGSIVGTGFFTTCASEKDYPDALKAKQIVDDWNRANNLDGKLQVMAKELVITGSSLAQKIPPKTCDIFRHIPIYTFDRIITNEFGTFEPTEYTRRNRVEMGYLQLSKYGGKLIPPDSMVHLCWNPVDDSGWGCGLMRSILETYSWQEENTTTKKWETFTRRPLMDMKAAFDEQLTRIVEKYAGPTELYVTDKKSIADQLGNQFQTAPKQGARIIAYGGTVDVKSPPLEPRARFMEYLNYLFNLVCLAGQTPMPRLFTTSGWTEASARVGQEIFNVIVSPIQRLIKRETEAIWDTVITQAKFDPVKAQVRLNWGMEKKPEIQLADLIKLAEVSTTTGIQYIRPEELRKNLVKFGFETWVQKEEKEVAGEVQPQPQEAVKA